MPGDYSLPIYASTSESTCPTYRLLVQVIGIVRIIDVVPMYLRVLGRSRGYFFDSRFQFTTTVRGGADAAVGPLTVLMRKRLPSAVTSYSKFVSTAGCSMCASNKATGVPASNVGFGPPDAFTGTAIIFPSAASKNNSLPSPRQRGACPPATEIVHFPSAVGYGRTYTSRRPD